MTHFGRILLVVCMWAPCATLAWAKDAARTACVQSRDLDLTIRGCTVILSRGNAESRGNRVAAFNNRGVSYANKGENDRAIADYDEAIHLGPKDAPAYINRGVAYYNNNTGDVDRAIADLDEAIRLGFENCAGLLKSRLRLRQQG